MERPKQESGEIRQWRPSCASPRSGTLLHGLRWCGFPLTWPAKQMRLSPVGLAGVVASDLRRCCRIRCGWKIACGALRHASAKRMIRTSRR